MRAIKKIFGLTVLLLLFSAAAGAAVIDNANYNFNSGRVEISGKFLDSANGSFATVICLKGDADISTFTAEDVEKQAETEVSDGSFKLSFVLNNPTDNQKYTAYITVGDRERKSEFYYTSDIYSIYSDIMAQNDAENFADRISLYEKQLNLNDTVYSRISNQKAAAEMCYFNKSMINNPEGLKDAIKAASYVQALNESRLSEVFDERRFIADNILKMSETDKEYNVSAYELYENSITDTGKDKVLNNMTGKSFEDLKTMKNSFIYECTMAAIKNNKKSGTEHIGTLLNKNNHVLGFDLTNYNATKDNSIDLLLLNGSEWNKSDVQKVLNTKSTAKDNTRGDIGGGGGRGGVGSSASGGYSQSYPVNKTDTPSENKGFTDLDGYDWAETAIKSLYERNIINGKGDSLFCPEDYVTRAEFLKMIILTFGLDAESGESSFTDVSADDWFYPYVAAGVSLGIVTGYEDGSFGGENRITRQDAAVIIERTSKAAGVDFEEKKENKGFSDNEEISDYARAAVEKLVTADILHGADGAFLPKNNCTRAEAAVMLYNCEDALKIKEE